MIMILYVTALQLCPKRTANSVENEHLRSCGMGEEEEGTPVPHLEDVKVIEAKSPEPGHCFSK